MEWHLRFVVDAEVVTVPPLNGSPVCLLVAMSGCLGIEYCFCFVVLI
jgi:hypothetical protein